MNADYSKILLIMLLPIGDTLFATPTIQLLRKRFPDSYIAALAYPTNKGILEGNPDINEIFVYPTLRTKRRILGFPSLFQTIKERRFELAVELAPFTMWLSRIIFGIPDRVRVNFPSLWWLLPDRNLHWKTTHAARHYYSTISALTEETRLPEPRMTVTASEKEYARALLWEEGLLESDTLVAIHPGGKGFSGRKRWAPTNFSIVADSLIERFGVKVVLVGGEDEKKIAREVRAGMLHNSIDLSGKTTLKQTAAVIEKCNLFIGNDSSPLHIAAAIGTPVVGVFGPSNAANFRPLGERSIRLVRAAECNPCFNFVGSTPLWQRTNCRTCGCLERLNPDDVTAAAINLLEQQTGLRIGVRQNPITQSPFGA